MSDYININKLAGKQREREREKRQKQLKSFVSLWFGQSVRRLLKLIVVEFHVTE